MNKTTRLGKRFLGSLLNGLILGVGTITILIGPIVALILFFVKKRSIGALICKYKYVNRDTGADASMGRVVLYFFMRTPVGILYFFTASILFWVDIATLQEKGGTFSEKWSGIAKIDKGSEWLTEEQHSEKKAKEEAKQIAMASKYVDTRTGEPALEIINFTKHYKGRPQPAVANASFKVFPGEFHGFIGANGAGKTTSIKSIIGAYAKYEGQVKIFGLPNGKIEAKRKLGYIPEAANFPKKFTTVEYITHMSRLSGLSKKDAKAKALQVLEEGNLMSIAKVSPNTLSSGQKKKVLLAQALVHNPSIVVMDEPAANLDPKARIEFFDTLKDLQKQKKSILISSHILAELDKYVDSVTILDGGKVVYSGLVKELTKNPLMTFRIKTSDDKAVKAHLTKAKINWSMSNDKDKVILADLLAAKNIMALQKFIITKNMMIEEFKNNVVTLEEVYENFVKYGSVDTGAGKKKVAKAETLDDKVAAKLAADKKAADKKASAKKPVAMKAAPKKATKAKGGK